MFDTHAPVVSRGRSWRPARRSDGPGARVPPRARGGEARTAGAHARGRADRSAPRVRRRRARARGSPRHAPHFVGRHDPPQRPLRAPLARQESRLHVCRARDAWPRHRREHDDVQRHRRRAGEAPALRRKRSAGAAPPVVVAGRTGRRAAVDPGAVRISRAAGVRLRRPGRVPPDVLRPDQARRSQPRRRGRRVREFLRRAAREADPRPDLPGRRRGARRSGGAAPQQRLLEDALRRRPEHRRAGLRDERPAAHRGGRAAAGADLPAGIRRLHADVGVSVPRARRGAHRGKLEVVLEPSSVRAAEAGSDDRGGVGPCRDRRGAVHARARRGVSRRARVRRLRARPARRADPQRAADAPDSAGRHRAGPAARVRERRQPHAGAHAESRPRACPSHRARRRPPAARRSAAHGKRDAGPRRRHRGAAARRNDAGRARHLHRPLYRARRGHRPSTAGCWGSRQSCRS